jgi:hypothetical protein
MGFSGKLPTSHHEHPARRGTGTGIGDLTSPLPPLTSAYVRANGKEPELTTKVADFQGTIDFIFVRLVSSSLLYFLALPQGCLAAPLGVDCL